MKRQRTSVITHGLVAGMVAHFVIALVVAVGDLASGRGALFTPTVLGAALLEGSRNDCTAPIGRTGLLAYTAVHLTALMGLGLLASFLIQKSEEQPGSWFGAWLVFFFVAWHMGAVVAGALGPVEGCLSLGWIFSASIAGAAGMAGYLWRVHPRLRDLLRTDRFA